MNCRFLSVFLAFSMLIISYLAEGQASRVGAGVQKFKYFQIPGRVKMDKGDPSGAVVRLINLDSKLTEKSIVVPSSGKFDLELSFFKEYKIAITKEGCYDKEIDVSTVIPRDVWDKDSIFPPFFIVVTLYKKVEDVRLSFEGKTIGKVTYSPNGTLDNFDSTILIDEQLIQDEINEALKNKDDKVFNQKIAEALEFEKKDDLSSAYSLYSEALKLKPSDKFVKEKLKELASDLKNLVGEAKIQAEFNRLIALGDVNVAGLKYTDAILNFKGALKVKPNEPIAVSKLVDAERLLALAGDKAKKDAEFNRLVASGDDNVSIKKYAEAIFLYKNALNLKNDVVVITKIAESERLMQLSEKEQIRIAAEKQAIASKSQKYKEAIARADQFFGSKSYTEAKVNYQQALLIDQSAVYPVEKMKEIQLILDALAAKQLADKKTAADDKLSSIEKLYLEKIKIADENFKKSQWSVARFYFIEALKIKQSDSYSLGKVDACDKMIDSGITAEKMQDYQNKITMADNEMKGKNFSSARFYYRTASDILPWEAYPKQQLKEIDRVVADKLTESDQRLFKENLAKADEAFNRKEYPTARFYYNKVIELSQSDHATSRLKEIESIVNGSESKKLNAAYDDLIKKGDEAVKQKNAAIARFYFQKASTLKPGENYPKEQMRKIDSGDVNL